MPEVYYDHLDKYHWYRYLSSGEVIAGGILIPLTCNVFVALRLGARRLKKSAITVDDWLSVVALVLLPGSINNKPLYTYQMNGYL